LLSGWGGDEGATYNGRGALAEALLSGQWRYLAKELRALHDVHGQSRLRTFRGELLHYLLPDAAHNLWHRWRGRGTNADSVQRMFRNRRYIAQGQGVTIGPDAVENRWQLLAAQPHLSRRTGSWARMGAHHGVAFTFPLLDRRVVELAWALPSTLFCRGGWKRRLYRDAMINVLPDLIRWRRNKLSPFPEVLLIQAIHRDQLLNHIEELRGHRLVADLFDLSAVQRHIEQLPTIDEARSMVLGEDRVRMTTVNRIVPMPLLHAMTWLLQHH
jgi:asparagine synthase (glutamine-hydrolysing)